MSDPVSRLNTLILPFAAILILFVVLQATLFLRHALKFNRKHQLYTASELREAVKTSAVGTIGPAFSAMVVVLSLIPIVGSVVTFMRCGVIGAADFELLNANIAVESMGLSFGDVNFTEAAMTVALFGMTIASAPYFIHLLITCKPLDKAMIKASQKKRSFIPMLSMGAEMGFIGYWALEQGSASVPNTVTIIVGLFCALGVGVLAQKSNHPKLKEWTMAIAMVCGMIGGELTHLIMN